MLLRVLFCALLLFSSIVRGKHHQEPASDHSSDHDHGHAITPSPDTAPPVEDWRRYVPPEYRGYLPPQPADQPTDQPAGPVDEPNERARARYDPSYSKYGKPYNEHDDEPHDHKHRAHDEHDDDKGHDQDSDHDKDKVHHDDKKEHSKHYSKESKYHDKHDDKHGKHNDQHNDKHYDKHHKSKHSDEHSKHSLADIDELNDEFDEGFYFSRNEEAVDEVQETADGTNAQSTWSWFGMIALFLISAVVALVVFYWMTACVVAYLHRRRYRQLEQSKEGWVDEEAMGLNLNTTA